MRRVSLCAVQIEEHRHAPRMRCDERGFRPSDLGALRRFDGLVAQDAIKFRQIIGISSAKTRRLYELREEFQIFVLRLTQKLAPLINTSITVLHELHREFTYFKCICLCFSVPLG